MSMSLHAKALATWALLPIYVVQGIGVRLRSHRMLPAAGPTAAASPGQGDPIRLLVIGDSSVAGTGIARLERGFAHQIAEALANLTGRTVEYRSHGFPSATAGAIRDHVVPNLPERPVDAVVLAVGINDAKNWHTARRWKREFGSLIYALRARYPGALVAWSQNMRFSKVPVLPWPLSEILSARGDLFNAIATQLCRERGACYLPRFENIGPDAFTSDGFHPSEAAHRAWGEAMAALLAKYGDFPRRSDLDYTI